MILGMCCICVMGVRERPESWREMTRRADGRERQTSDQHDRQTLLSDHTIDTQGSALLSIWKECDSDGKHMLHHHDHDLATRTMMMMMMVMVMGQPHTKWRKTNHRDKAAGSRREARRKAGNGMNLNGTRYDEKR